MLTLNRQRISPNRSFLDLLTTRSIATWIPTGFRWFAPAALGSDKELGKHVRAWGKVLGGLSHEVEKQRYNIFLSTATGDALSELGLALGYPRKAGENDDLYAQRIAAELLIDRVTPNAIQAIVPFLTGGQHGASLYEPWRKILFRGERSVRSGGHRRVDTEFYRGGVFELQTDVYVPGLSDFVFKSKAAGTQYYLALMMEAQLAYNDDPLSALFPTDVAEFERQDFVTNSFEVWIESVGCSTDQDVVVIELPMSLEVLVHAGHKITLASCFTFENLSRNYALYTDMIASAEQGIPVYFVKESPFSPEDPTDIQPAPYIAYETFADGSDTLESPGVVF